MVVVGCKVGIQLVLSVRTLICGPSMRLFGFLTAWRLVSRSKCPKRQEVEDTSFLRPRSGNWYSIILLYSNDQAVTKPGSKGEDIDLFLKREKCQRIWGPYFKNDRN